MEPPTTDEIPIISKPFRAAELSKTIARMIGQSPRQVSVC